MLSFFRLWRFRDMFSWLCQSSLKATSAGRSSTKENLIGTLYLHRSRNPGATIWDIHPRHPKPCEDWRICNHDFLAEAIYRRLSSNKVTNSSAVHRSAVNLDSWTRREEKMSPSLKSAFFTALSALIKVWLTISSLGDQDKSDTNSEHGSEFCHYLGSTAETICGHLRTADTGCRTRRRLQNLLMLWTRRTTECFLEKIANVA